MGYVTGTDLKHRIQKLSIYPTCTWMSHPTRNEWVLCDILMGHATRLNASCQTYRWVMSQVLTRNTEFRSFPLTPHIHECAISHIWMSHVRLMDESCQSYWWVMSLTCMGHVRNIDWSCHRNWLDISKSEAFHTPQIYMNESSHTYEWVVLYIDMCKKTHSFFSYVCEKRVFIQKTHWMSQWVFWMSEKTVFIQQSHWMSQKAHRLMSHNTQSSFRRLIEWVFSHISMSHVRYRDGSCNIYE